jgi:uncharacterized 2Fe-2S/4Fe-4S cluster protein (DUF4445 family)
LPTYAVTFLPHGRTVRVEHGESLLVAASQAHIALNNLCGGDGICGRCRMIVKNGDVEGGVSAKLTREEIRRGMVLACMSTVAGDLTAEIPVETMAGERVLSEEDSDRFRFFEPGADADSRYQPAPLVRKVYLELDPPGLASNAADHQRVSEAIQRVLETKALQMGLKIMRNLPEILRADGFRVTATVGLRQDVAEVMDVEPGDTSASNYMVVVDIGTTTVVAHLVDANTIRTMDAKACFNSQGVYGREVTGRMISAEKRGVQELHRLLMEDINGLVRSLADANHVNPRDINAVVCAGNTAMGHFLLGLPTYNIRRTPYVPTTVEPPPLRAAEVGIQINPRGLLYSLPGISGWVGSDLTAGILATRMHEREELALLVDIGTNGEVIVGNRDWLVACSASAGPAFEGANEESGMRAERGAIERVCVVDGQIRCSTIGSGPPRGICGSGIIDLVAVLFRMGLLDRSGKLAAGAPGVVEAGGIRHYVVADGRHTETRKPIVFSEAGIEHVVGAKAAIFAAMKVVLTRLDLTFMDVERFYIAGAFGSYLDVESAVTIGLIPDIPRERFVFSGNTSIIGAKLAAYYQEAFQEIRGIRESCTYYDLMGADDYVEEFRKAMFLPHTDIQDFPSVRMAQEVSAWRSA